MNILQIIWDVDPVMVEIGPLQLRYYGLLFAFGFLIGYFVLKYFFRKEKAPVEEIDKMALYIILGAVIGARLGHVLFYEPKYYFANPGEILAVWKGGLASHGGTIGVVIGLWLYSGKSWNKSLLYILDRVVVPAALAGCMIRIGNLFNSEIYGCETNLPWGFVFVRDGNMAAHHPTQIYESLSYLLIFAILMLMYRRRGGKINRGFLCGWGLTLIFTQRFLIEFIKNVQVDFESTMLLNMGQLLSIPFIAVGIFLIFYSKKLGPVPALKNDKKAATRK